MYEVHGSPREFFPFAKSAMSSVHVSLGIPREKTSVLRARAREPAPGNFAPMAERARVIALGARVRGRRKVGTENKRKRERCRFVRTNGLRRKTQLSRNQSLISHLMSVARGGGGEAGEYSANLCASHILLFPGLVFSAESRRSRTGDLARGEIAVRAHGCARGNASFSVLLATILRRDTRAFYQRPRHTCAEDGVIRDRSAGPSIGGVRLDQASDQVPFNLISRRCWTKERNAEAHVDHPGAMTRARI